MTALYKIILLITCIYAGTASQAQTLIKGKVIDASSKEPIAGASISTTRDENKKSTISTSSGEFEMKGSSGDKLIVTSIGYSTQEITIDDNMLLIQLSPSASQLVEVVVSANRGEAIKRSAAPIAISTISSKMLKETKATSADQVLNKVSGVNMVNLGNEQHQMSIRQPMTTKSLFLYLEDGIPIRTSGLYNHNALLEMNMTATRNIEVIKGPSSSLYGSEAIGGVVNFISASPTAIPVLKLSLQGNNIGYKRADVMSSVSSGKWGFVLSGYYADKRNGTLEYSDFHKGIITARIDYKFSDKTTLTNSITYLKYFSEMSGSIDSTMFARKTFSNMQTFTYRKVDALRYHSTLTHTWNDDSKSTVTFLYRDNAIGQNPAYRVKDDYRKQGNVFVGKKNVAHGEINESSFNSYSLIAQHRQNLHWKNAMVIGGVSTDISPSDYSANYIRIKKDTVANKYVSFQKTDSILTNYSTKLNNYAAFLNFEFSPIEKMHIVASLRYDYFNYNFNNHLKPSAFSGSPDTVNHFSRISPKVGFTYNFSKRTGIYANYSEGFVPPQVTEMYTGVKVPNLDPATFSNYEVGGWVEVVQNHLSIDASLYRLEGTNEIISVKQDDGSFANQNAGETLHQGIEVGLNATPMKDVSFRLSGAYSKHEFVNYVEKGTSFNGNEMSNAPNWIYNAEVWYRPPFVKGLRLGMELQHVGSYFVDPKNTATYQGYEALNVRAGYQFKCFEIWLNVLNATDAYYSNITTKSASGYSYQLADPRNFNLGVSYDFGNLFKKNQ